MSPRIFVTGATGQLGRLVIAELLKTVPASALVAGVRDPGQATDLAALGVAMVAADYDQPATLDRAFAGIDRLLLISGNEPGRRLPQHRSVIEAATRAGVKLIAYTSLLRADTSPLGLAVEHKQTEALLRACGGPFVVLRNGWYTENDVASAPMAVAHGAVIGCAGDGRISAAARADYAAAAAVVLTAPEAHAGQIYELAGDAGFTRAEQAAEIARQSGKPVEYRNLPEADYKAALLGFGLPEPVAELVADADAKAAQGALFDDGHALSRLIGRPTTPLSASVAAALNT